MHLLVSVVWAPFLFYFIHLQKCNRNFTEMGAGITAVVLAIYFILRTIWDLVQLEAFKQWNIDDVYTLTT